jgi:hypothetical protein
MSCQFPNLIDGDPLDRDGKVRSCSTAQLPGRRSSFSRVTCRSAAARSTATLQYHPRPGVRLPEFSPREARRLLVDDYELRYEIRGSTVFIINLWHTREHRWPSG